jgi:hypothetical protein
MDGDGTVVVRVEADGGCGTVTLGSLATASEAMAQSPVMKNVKTLIHGRNCIGRVLIGG